MCGSLPPWVSALSPETLAARSTLSRPTMAGMGDSQQLWEAEQAALAGLQGAISSENIVQLKQAITGAEKLDFAPPELEEAGRLLAQLQVRHCHVMCSAAFPLFSLRFLLSGRMFVRHDV